MVLKSSPWYSTSDAARKRKPVEITLSEVAHARLSRLALSREMSRSQVVEELIAAAFVRGARRRKGGKR